MFAPEKPVGVVQRVVHSEADRHNKIYNRNDVEPDLPDIHCPEQKQIHNPNREGAGERPWKDGLGFRV